MTTPNHKYFFYTGSHSLLFSSLHRFFDYILNRKLNPFSVAELVASLTTILVYQEEKENPELLKIIADNRNIRIVILGFDSNSSINLCDFVNLKNKFVFELRNNDSRSHQLFTDEELKEKLKNFFHSHGDDSLFEYLNWTYYFLSNGPEQFIKNEITYEEYQEAFLIPGLKKWDYFKSRFVKYKDIIKSSIYKATQDELEIVINEADNYINELSRMDREKILSENIDFYNEKIEKVKKIDDILSAFYRKLSFEGSPLQNTTGR